MIQTPISPCLGYNLQNKVGSSFLMVESLGIGFSFTDSPSLHLAYDPQNGLANLFLKLTLIKQVYLHMAHLTSFGLGSIGGI